MNNRHQNGIGLVFVLVLISIFMLFMLVTAQQQQIENRSRAFGFSVAQTEAVLNTVYAYYKSKNAWPVDRGRCQLPQGFLLRDGDSFNGWGYALRGDNGCNTDARRFNYKFSQLLPEEQIPLFLSRFSERMTTSGVGAPRGTRWVTVEMDRTGGALKQIQFDKLGDSVFNPLQADLPDCFNSAGVAVPAKVVVGLDGACTARTDPIEFGGFRYRLTNTGGVFYDFMVQQVDADGNYAPVIEDEFSVAPPESSDDGHIDADDDCPHLSPFNTLNTLILAWCP